MRSEQVTRGWPALVSHLLVTLCVACRQEPEPQAKERGPDASLAIGPSTILPLPAGEYVGAAVLGDGSIFVADFAAATVRRLRGDSAEALGRNGAGPGEFRWLQAVRQCTKDTVIAYDFNLTRLQLYGPSGYVGQYQLPARLAGAEFLGCLRSGVLVFTQIPDMVPGLGNQLYDLRVSALRLADTSLVALGRLRGIDMYVSKRYSAYFPRPFGVSTLVSVAGDHVAFVEDSALRVLRLSERGALDTLFSAEVIRQRATETDRARYLEERLASQPDSSTRRTLRGVLQEVKWGTFVSAVDAIIGTLDGFVWIRQTPVDGNEFALWHRIGPDGTTETALLPRGFRCLYAEPGRLVGVESLTDSTERVIALSIVPERLSAEGRSRP